ncbi:ABC transporter substrate-binding protein [Janibacter hoylei]|uniref:ABC transporter substrate-binding protein n=1 Tax=Janibacter hoylei TaxID=364298 RepID=UPI0024901329|nr:ABC transporter substrate-binding protein [Janibacter hoylei]
MWNKTVLRWVAAVLIASTSLAGCGGGEDEQLIKVGSTGTSLTFTPITAPVALDSFADQGLEVELTDFAASSPNALAALTGGGTQVGVIGASNVFDAIEAGAPLVVIGGSTRMASEMAVNADVAEERGLSADAPIAERVRDLKGLTIHTTAPGGATSQTLRVMLKQYGLDPDEDVKIVPSEPSRIIAGLSDGSVDAAFYSTGTMDNNYLDGSALQYINLPRGDVPELTDSLFVLHVTTKKYYDEHRETLARYMDAVRAAGKELGEEPLPELKEKYFPDMADDLFASAWSSVHGAWIGDASISEEQWEASLKLQTEITGKDYSDLDYGTYVHIPTSES